MAEIEDDFSVRSKPVTAEQVEAIRQADFDRADERAREHRARRLEREGQKVDNPFALIYIAISQLSEELHQLETEYNQLKELDVRRQSQNPD